MNIKEIEEWLDRAATRLPSRVPKYFIQDVCDNVTKLITHIENIEAENKRLKNAILFPGGSPPSTDKYTKAALLKGE